ncbi:MAG: helix-turn-helix domain-containing protein [Chitinivibrionales bacterium]|nr:helix-turn-helix domain-containing protein [Chitinivibrionales bacterium]
MSNSRTCGIFKKCLDISPMAYIKGLRLKRSAAFLVTTDWSLKESPNKCGFYDAFHFSRSFNRQYGIPPSQF